MTWNLAQTMSLIKAAQHKYTHRKLVGRDPKTNRPRYRYYYARHHGGGITSAAFEAGNAFKLTFKGRRGHFHIQRVEGNKVFVKHDGRPGSKEVEMSQDELRALLEKQHSELETKGREKAQRRRKSAAKKRKSTKRTKRKKTQTQTPREQLTNTAQQSADNFTQTQSKKAREAISATPRTEEAAARLIENSPLETIPYILLEAVRADKRGEEGFKDLIRIAAAKVSGLGVSVGDVMKAAQNTTGAPVFAVYDDAHYEGDVTPEKHAGLLRRAEHMGELIKEGGRAEMTYATELRNIYRRILPGADTEDINAIATRRTPEAKRRELLEGITQQIAESAPESLEIQNARRELKDAEQALNRGVGMSPKEIKDAVAERDKKAAKVTELTETAQQGADNFETMPEEPRNLKTARRELKDKEEILEGSKRAGTSKDKLAEIEREISDKRAKVEVLEEDHLSNVFADNLRSSAESAKGKRLIDALAEAHEKREGVEGAERALIDFYKETALKRKGSQERLKDREFKDLRNIKNRWLESDEDTLYDSLKEQETEARQIYLKHASAGDDSPYTQAQVDAAVKRQTERGARAEALKFAYTEGMLKTAQELKAQDETAQQSQTAQAFSGLVDAIKSGEGTQAAQRAFKTALDTVLNKTESGTLTDAERAELLPIAEQLVEVTSGRARALMTVVRDQIKGSSERGEVEEETQSTRPQIKSREEAAEYLKESLLEELGEGHSVKVWRKERSGKSPIVRVYVQQKLRRGWSDMGYYSISDKGKVYPNFDRRPAGMRDLAAYIMQRADLDI
jgi:hypothetical protein